MHLGAETEHDLGQRSAGGRVGLLLSAGRVGVGLMPHCRGRSEYQLGIDSPKVQCQIIANRPTYSAYERRST